MVTKLMKAIEAECLLIICLKEDGFAVSAEEIYNRIAKRCIQEMREPTELMQIVAGHQAHVIDYYEKMIDAALKDE